MTERELSRAAARRLAIIRHAEEVSGNVALTCRYYGISRTLFYTWRRRYEELGIDGLRPRSRRPHTSPNATSGEVIGKIVHLRKTYHFGPAKISIPEALPRSRGEHLRGVADPEAPGDEPASVHPTLPPPRRSLEAIR